MAKVKFSALVSEMRNKLNGSVFSKNRAGNFLRNKVTPVNPKTSFQSDVRANLATHSSAWKGLTEAQIAGWNEAAKNFPYTDIFGDTKYLSGFNLYVKLSMNLQIAGVAAISQPPAPLTTIPIALVSITAAAGVITLSIGPTTVPADQVYVVEMTPGVSPGRNFLKNFYRQITVIDEGTSTASFNVTAAYTARLGTPDVGTRVGVRVYSINKDNGQATPAAEASTIVTV